MDKATCAENECERPVKNRLLCSMHYYWHKRHGTIDQFPYAPPAAHGLVLKKVDGSFAVCHTCGPQRPKHRTRKDGRVEFYCSLRRPRKRTPAESRAEHFWIKYKIRLADFEAMSEAQDGRCAICRRDRFLVVDHCHDTGAVRGLLCRQCNTGIGQLGDSSQALEHALEYLRAHEQGQLPLAVKRAA